MLGLAIVNATVAIVGIIFVIVGFWKNSDLLFYIGVLLILTAGLVGFIGAIDSMI